MMGSCMSFEAFENSNFMIFAPFEGLDIAGAVLLK